MYPQIRDSIERLRPTLTELAGTLRALPASELTLAEDDLEGREILGKILGRLDEDLGQGDKLGGWGQFDLRMLAGHLSYGAAVLNEVLPPDHPSRQVVALVYSTMDREFATSATVPRAAGVVDDVEEQEVSCEVTR